MNEEGDAFEVTVSLTRGTSTDDRDKIRAKVSAGTERELEEKLGEMRRKVEETAEWARTVQPNDDDEDELPEDQSTLTVEGSA